jgi:hypothetical protein
VERSATAGSRLPKNISPARGEIINQHKTNTTIISSLWDFGELGGGFPAVALRFTAGYAYLVPCGTLKKTFADLLITEFFGCFCFWVGN